MNKMSLFINKHVFLKLMTNLLGGSQFLIYVVSGKEGDQGLNQSLETGRS